MVTYTERNGKLVNYVITGNINIMWFRDSSAQAWSYLAFAGEDKRLLSQIDCVLNHQTSYILKEPYAKAFYDDQTKVGELASVLTDMKPGVRERKWEIDSLCYHIRLGYNYWKNTGDTSPFDEDWQNLMKAILAVLKDQQLKQDLGDDILMRETLFGLKIIRSSFPEKLQNF